MIFTTIGIGLLLVVFYLAYEMFTHPVPGLAQGLSATSSSANGASDSIGQVGRAIAAFLVKLALLFVMTLAGSHIAARGIQLFHGGTHASAGANAVSIPASNGRPVEPPVSEVLEVTKSADLQ